MGNFPGNHQSSAHHSNEYITKQVSRKWKMALASFLTYVKNSQLKVEIRFELIISGNHSQSVSYIFIKTSSVAEIDV